MNFAWDHNAQAATRDTISALIHIRHTQFYVMFCSVVVLEMGILVNGGTYVNGRADRTFSIARSKLRRTDHSRECFREQLHICFPFPSDKSINQLCPLLECDPVNGAQTCSRSLLFSTPDRSLHNPTLGGSEAARTQLRGRKKIDSILCLSPQ